MNLVDAIATFLGNSEECTFQSIEEIGKEATINKKNSKMYCHQLLANNSINKIKKILSRSLSWNHELNNEINMYRQIGSYAIYSEILKKSYTATFLKALDAIFYPSLSCFPHHNETIQGYRLKLFEKILSQEKGYEGVIKKINEISLNDNFNPSNIIILTSLIRQKPEKDINAISIFDQCVQKENISLEDLFPLFELLLEINTTQIKNFIINQIENLSEINPKNLIDVHSNLLNKNLFFIKLALEKDLFIEEIYKVATDKFYKSTSMTYSDWMHYPTQILEIFIRLNYKRNEMFQLLLECKDRVYQLNDSDELIFYRDKKLKYISNLFEALPSNYSIKGAHKKSS